MLRWYAERRLRRAAAHAESAVSEMVEAARAGEVDVPQFIARLEQWRSEERERNLSEYYPWAVQIVEQNYAMLNRAIAELYALERTR